MKNFTKVLTLLVALVLSSLPLPSQAGLEDSLTIMELKRPVHFLAPDGSDVLITTGTYLVEPAEEWIRVMSGEPQDAVLIEAKKGTHELALDQDQVMVMSKPGESDAEKDLYFVMLLLPGGQSLEAMGTYSGIRPRGFFDRAFNHMKQTAKKVASKVKKAGKKLPKVRSLSRREINLAKSVFRKTINYSMVKITNTLGAGGRPWTTNTPPMYMINVGQDYSSLTANDERKRLLIHELVHVWQGQHLVPFMLNSAAHQTLSAINNGGDTAPAYSYRVGKSWKRYNVEQQASIVAHWYTPANICFESGPCGGGMKTSDSRYRYVRDHIRKNKPN